MCIRDSSSDLTVQVHTAHLELLLQLLVLLLDMLLLFNNLVQLIANRLVSLLLFFEFITQIGDYLGKRHLCKLSLLLRCQLHVRAGSIVHELGPLAE